jgi:hypothetical protein
MHKPTLIKVLRILKNYDQANGDMIHHVVTMLVTQDPTLDPQKLLAGAGIRP